MAKFALLIGVAEYQSSELQNLAAAIPDVMAMQHILEDPAIADFASSNVEVLRDPEPQQMRESIERLFANRQRDDLLLLYFSGHGVVDDFGKFHLTSARTDNGFLNSTAIPATFVHGLMESSRSQQQVVILDCCSSGAFAKEMRAKGEVVNFQSQLGGKGRAVLTSSSATEYSFEQKESELSVYTQYVVEGLRTGIADRNEDGVISVDELHEFAGEKVREVAPAMQPKIYAVEEGYNIIIAKAPIGDSKLAYRKEVERLAKDRNGQLSEIVLTALDTKQQQLGISNAEAEGIRQEVLSPYQEFAKKFQKYQKALQKSCDRNSQVTQQSWKDLQYLQQTLGLTDKSIQPLIDSVTIAVDYAHPASKTRLSPELNLKNSSLSLPFKPQSKYRISSQIFMKTIAFFSMSGLVFAMPNLKLVQPVVLTQESRSPQISPIESAKIAEESAHQGQKKYDQKNFQGAIDDYTNAIQLKPDDAALYQSRGQARKDFGQKKDAIDDYTQAIRVKPNQTDLYYQRGTIYHDLGDSKNALADYSQAIQLKPDVATTYWKRGELYRELGKGKNAIEDYTKSLEFRMTEPWLVYHKRGIIKRSLSDKNGAIEDYKKAIQLKPDFAETYYNRGLISRELDNSNGAIADFQKAADLYKKQGKSQDAQDALKQVQQLQQSQPVQQSDA
jgi:tetratricopeptide (TPR) repeat protein